MTSPAPPPTQPSLYIPLVNDTNWAVKENIAEIDAIVSDLTNSIDDMGALLAPMEHWKPARNKFPLVHEDPPKDLPVKSIFHIPDDDDCLEKPSTSFELDSKSVEAPEILIKPRVKLITANPDDKDREIRRWSMMSTSSAVRPPDAVSCDCAAMAFASLRKSKKSRRKMLKFDEEAYCQSSSGESPPDSPDSGISSAASSECSSSRSFEEQPCPLPTPTRGEKKKKAFTRGRNGRVSLRLMFGSVFRRLLYASKKTPFIEVENDASISPRWRGDDTGEAIPVTRDVAKPIPNHSTPKSASGPVKQPDFPGTPIKPLTFDTSTDVITPKSTTRSKNAPLSLPPIRTPQLQRLKSTSIAGKLANIQRFHYPQGKPVNKEENDRRLNQIRELFAAHPQSQLPYKNMEDVCKAMNFAIYTKRTVFEACCKLANKTIDEQVSLNFREFSAYWNEMTSKANDEASRFVFTLALAGSGEKNRQYVTKEDFNNMLMDLIHTHPGLHFLADAPQFHARYVDVVVGRIFWNVNRSWTGRITAMELRKSNFLETLRLLDDINDINKITDYFSYEHFYVAYCKFWEIDTDHDMVISRTDMRQHCGGALTNRIIDRIFSFAVTRTPSHQRIYGNRGPVHEQPIETIGFEHFVSFLLAEEDKRHPTSIEYWFRCLDLDGDGMISLYEMEYFYQDIERKLLDKNFETLSFNDVVCNLLDLVAPKSPNFVTLKDLKKCGLAHRFFNTFVNYIKYCEQESSDGERASVKMNGDKEMSDWDQFCAVEYEMLMAETEQNDGYADDSIDVNLDDDDADVSYP